MTRKMECPSKKKDDPANETYPIETATGITDYLIFLGNRLFNLPKWKMQLLWGFRIVFRQSFDHLINYGIAVKLKQVLSCGRISFLIKLIEEAIFNEDPSRTDEQKLERRQMAEHQFKTYLKFLVLPIGKSKYDKGTDLIFRAVQDPLLNKQLVYELLEIAIRELFPELI